MEVDRDEDKKEMSFVPSALSDSAGWYEPKFMCGRELKFMCDRECSKEGFKVHATASVMVEDDGELTAQHLCMNCLT